MGRLINTDDLMQYAFGNRKGLIHTADIDKVPSAQPDKEALDDAYAHGYTAAESEFRKRMDEKPEPQWIPCSEPPKESGTYIVTAYDGIDKRVTFVKYQKTLKRWDLTGARAYWRILAYKPLPEPWRGEEHETTL